MSQKREPREIFFDATQLEHPKPLEMAVEYLKKLDDQSYLYMRHRKNPLPLLEIAQNNGFLALSREDSEGIWHIVITLSSKHSPEALIRV